MEHRRGRLAPTFEAADTQYPPRELWARISIICFEVAPEGIKTLSSAFVRTLGNKKKTWILLINIPFCEDQTFLTLQLVFSAILISKKYKYF